MRPLRVTSTPAPHDAQAGGLASHQVFVQREEAPEITAKPLLKLLHMNGGVGYLRGSPIERLYCDIRVARIYEGANEAQRTTSTGYEAASRLAPRGAQTALRWRGEPGRPHRARVPAHAPSVGAEPHTRLLRSVLPG